MKKVHIDFETRSRVNIWDTGAYVYAASPTTEPLCVAYAVGEEPVKIIRKADIDMWPLIDPFEELRELAKDPEVLFYAHNALFEQLIWKFKFQAFDLPPLPIIRWR